MKSISALLIILCAAAQCAPLKSPAIVEGINIYPADGGVKVTAGKCKVDGKVVSVKETLLKVDPSESVFVRDEKISAPVSMPEGYGGGQRLRGPNGWDANARFSYDPGTLVLKKDGVGLKLGKDYNVSDEFGMIGLTETSSAKPRDFLSADYSFSLLRVDSVFVTPKGEVVLKKGDSHVSTPLPPKSSGISLRVANIFVNYRAKEVKAEDIYPVVEGADKCKTGTTKGLLPKTVEKLKTGEHMRIVFWGDSVTSGGNAYPGHCFAEAATAMLKTKYPNADMVMFNESYPASNTNHWMEPEKNPFPGTCDFELRVMSLKPDVVVMEFVNDSWFDTAMLNTRYKHIKERLTSIGCEWVICTPHFVYPPGMGDFDGKTDSRPYVKFLREFTSREHIALADNAARWEHLYLEGIPYITMLGNTINHPDNRGHRLFAEEIVKCFE